jgi:hypothetical protein
MSITRSQESARVRIRTTTNQHRRQRPAAPVVLPPKSIQRMWMCRKSAAQVQLLVAVPHGCPKTKGKATQMNPPARPSRRVVEVEPVEVEPEEYDDDLF